jgi:uncharacterized membrane protein YsdA (DUF1294 family)
MPTDREDHGFLSVIHPIRGQDLTRAFMTIGVALCLSWVILAFFILFSGWPSDGRSWILQTGSVALGVAVWGTAVYATLYHWSLPLVCGLASSWTFASWVALSAIAFAAYWYDQRAAVAQVRRIAEWAFILLSFLGGWGGVFAAQFLLPQKQQGVGMLVVTAVTLILNSTFWAWIGAN